MKRFFFALNIVASLIIIILSSYILIKINFIFSNIDGQLYDGFGTPYNNGEPNSPYTIIGYIGFIGGISWFINACSKNKLRIHNNKELNINERNINRENEIEK